MSKNYRPSVMQHQFATLPKADIQRSSFNRSHGYKTTFNSGYLVPFYVDECLPGDTFIAQTTVFARLATPIVPIMDNVFLETFYFAVPIRLIWENWQRFNGEQTDPGDSTDFLVPQISSGSKGFDVMSISDYFGLPTSIPNLSVSALWHRAYNLVYNEWFRDENLQDSVPIHRGDGPDPIADYTLLRRGKRHDYFTSALPWPQKGPGIELPLGSYAPVIGDGTSLGLTDGTASYGVYSGGSGALGASTASYGVTLPGAGTATGGVGAGKAIGVVTEGKSGLIADLSEATAATINSLRQAFQLQKLLERDARGGTRYTEIIRSHFGVTSPDARLQRPEFLGGGSSRVHIQPVQQMSSTDSITPQGNLAAFGLAMDSGHSFSYSATEHCVLIGLINVRADLTYQQGIDRMFSRRTRWDYYWPALAHLGEQAILNKEIYAQGTSQDDEVFGYQERFAEYRYGISKITGKFRSTDPQSLDVWHLSQKFDSLPTLSDAFIQDDPPIKRVVAVQDEPEFLLDTYMSLRCVRPMPIYSIPGLVDHF